MNRSDEELTLSFETLYDGQFASSTELIISNYPVILSHRRSSAVSLETFPLYYEFHSRAEIFFNKKIYDSLPAAS